MYAELEKCIFEKYEKLRTAVGIAFAGIPVSPNLWTALVVLCAIGGFVALACANFQVGLLVFALSVVFDIIDGGVARVRKGETPFGAWLDDVSDGSRELLLLLSLFVAPIAWVCPYASKELSLVVIIVLAMLIDFVKMHAYYKKILKGSDIAGFARIERVERFAIILVGLAIYNFEQAALTYAIVIALLLSVFRIAQILHFVFKKENERFKRVRKIREMI